MFLVDNTGIGVFRRTPQSHLCNPLESAVPFLLSCRCHRTSYSQRGILSRLMVIFWIGIVSHKSLPLPLRLCAVVIVLSCPSSCDAERAISVLNRIVTALRNRVSWGNITIHLIEAEDLNRVGYPYDELASTWGARRRQRTTPKAKHKASLRKHGRQKRAMILLCQGENALSHVSDFGDISVSSVSSLSSISDSGNSSSGGTSVGGDSGSGSDSSCAC